MSSRSFARCVAVAIALAAPLARGRAAHAAWGLPAGAAASAASDPSGPPEGAQPTVVAEVPAAEAAPGGPLPEPSPPAPPDVPAMAVEQRKVADLPPRRLRPRFVIAVSMGTSIDASWSASNKTFLSPTFSATVGFGEGPLGFSLRLLSSQASGRGADSGPDRLSLDAMITVRPWGSRRTAEGLSWAARVLRTVALDGGLAIERISQGAAADLRGGPVFGGHVDLPVTAAATDGELRLRLSVRRMLAGTRALGSGRVGDSTEVLGGLVVAF